jgi:hypothetical protein
MAVVMLVVFSAPSVRAEAIVRFVNGREVVVREYWVAGSELRFTWRRGSIGTIGVPRTFVAAIEPLAPARKIGGTSPTVNATPLVAPTAFR